MTNFLEKACTSFGINKVNDIGWNKDMDVFGWNVVQNKFCLEKSGGKSWPDGILMSQGFDLLICL